MASATIVPDSTPPQDLSMADDPLFLHYEKSPGAILVSQTLVGENYPAWARSIWKALLAKNKLGFINDTLTLSSPLLETPSTIQAWIRFDNMVGTWKINSVSPKIQASIIYMDTTLEIWNDLKEQFPQGNGLRIFNLQKEIPKLTQGDASITNTFTQLNASKCAFGVNLGKFLYYLATHWETKVNLDQLLLYRIWNLLGIQKKSIILQGWLLPLIASYPSLQTSVDFFSTS